MVDFIGTQVNVPGTRGKGILRYCGSIHGKNGIFAGIELLGPIALTRGKNNGDVEGIQYFHVQQPMSGLFLPFERLRTVNPQIEFTKDMIHEINSSTPVSINEPIDAFSEVNDGAVASESLGASPMPHGDAIDNGSSIPRPYSADVSKTRFTNSPILNSSSSYSTLTLNKSRQSTDQRSRTSSVSSFSKSPILNSAYRSHSLNMDPRYQSPLYQRYSNGSTTGSNINSNGNVGYLEQELFDLRSKYEKSEREMSEKLSVLNELRETVQDLQPILKQYENELNEKDKKISKIRSEFETAREDWRQNLDIMVNTYEANEEFYETKIKELQLKLSETNSIENPKEFDDLKLKFENLTKLNAENESKLQLKIKDLENNNNEIETIKQLNNKISEQQTEIENLSSQVVELSKFPNDNDSSIPKSNELKNALDELDKLKSKVELLTEENETLKRDLERRHSFEKLEDKNTEINKLHDDIQGLNDKLISKTKEIETLEDDLDLKVKQISDLNAKLESSETIESTNDNDDKIKDLEQDLLFKDQEIKALQQQLDKLTGNLSTQKQKIKDLEAAQKNNDVGNNHNHDTTHNDDNDIKLKQLETQQQDFVQQINEKEQIIKELERKLQESITNEIDSLNINDAAAINHMSFQKEIDDLKREIDSRPTIEELTELQDNIDEMVRLHNNEIFFKDEEYQKLVNENTKLLVRLERALEGSILTNRISDNTSHESVSIHSDLPVYKPETELDPSDGKDNWCGLCERDGHSSVNCPYENDIF